MINTSWGTCSWRLDGTNYALAQDIRDTLLNSSTKLRLELVIDRMIVKAEMLVLVIRSQHKLHVM